MYNESIDSISKEINSAEHEYMNMCPLTYWAGDATDTEYNRWI